MMNALFVKEQNLLLFKSKEAKILTLSGKVSETAGVASARGERIVLNSWLPVRGAELVLGMPGIDATPFSGACRYPGPLSVAPRLCRVMSRGKATIKQRGLGIFTATGVGTGELTDSRGPQPTECCPQTDRDSSLIPTRVDVTSPMFSPPFTLKGGRSVPRKRNVRGNF